MSKDFNNFLQTLNNEDVTTAWNAIESGIQDEAGEAKDDAVRIASYLRIYSERWSVFLLRQYHDWINS